MKDGFEQNDNERGVSIVESNEIGLPSESSTEYPSAVVSDRPPEESNDMLK